jgi:hypothetical protein
MLRKALKAQSQLRSKLFGECAETREALLKRHRLEVKERPTALRAPELDVSEGFHGDAPGEAGQGHNAGTDDRIGPVRRAEPSGPHRFLRLKLNSCFGVIRSRRPESCFNSSPSPAVSLTLFQEPAEGKPLLRIHVGKFILFARRAAVVDPCDVA